MAELEGPGRIAVDEDNGLAVALVDLVHLMCLRCGEEPALEREHLAGDPFRPPQRFGMAHTVSVTGRKKAPQRTPTEGWSAATGGVPPPG